MSQLVNRVKRIGGNSRPPLPGPNPGAPGNWGGKAGAPAPTPAAGPAREVGAAPRPAGRATPGPEVRPVGRPPVVVFPRRVLGSAGGADSTERETIWAPRRMVKPSVRFSSDSMSWVAGPAAPGAAGLFCFRLTRLNSSVSARTRFMCLSNASI